MFFFLPFRAKNPPERFPFVTLGLILLNTEMFVWMSQDFVVLSPGYRHLYGVTYHNMASSHLLTALFMHSNLLHLAGNMLFLWVFGAPLEGRLRPLRYLLLYLISGLAGNALYEIAAGYIHPDVPLTGASAAIMGLAGAYLYAFPYSPIRVLWMLLLRVGIKDVHAQWVVLFYLITDLVQAYWQQGSDSVAHLAHLGGAAVGLFLAFLFGVARDTEGYSAVLAIRSDMREFARMPFLDLEMLMQREARDPLLVMVYCEKALDEEFVNGEERCILALFRHSRLLDELADPGRLARIVLRLSLANAARLPADFYLGLGARLEPLREMDLAATLYERVYDIDQHAAQTEIALFRLLRIQERAYRDRDGAARVYAELARIFPAGDMVWEVQRTMPRVVRRAAELSAEGPSSEPQSPVFPEA
jgi:membrane associated rhomboid family serine protease